MNPSNMQRRSLSGIASFSTVGDFPIISANNVYAVAEDTLILYRFSSTLGKWQAVGTSGGAIGPQGPPGANGNPGIDGKDGKDGKDGGYIGLQEYVLDPSSPIPGDTWVLRTNVLLAGNPIGLLLALTSIATYTYAFSYRTLDGSTVRTSLA